MKITIDTTNCSREEVTELKEYLEHNCWNWNSDEKEEEEEKEVKYILGDNSIFVNGSHVVNINETINDEEMFGYRIIDRKEFISELIRWIAEASRDSSRANSEEMMREDMFMLQDLTDDYIFSSVSTNEYISSEDSIFNETCEELIVLNNSL